MRYLASPPFSSRDWRSLKRSSALAVLPARVVDPDNVFGTLALAFAHADDREPVGSIRHRHDGFYDLGRDLPRAVLFLRRLLVFQVQILGDAFS